MNKLSAIMILVVISLVSESAKAAEPAASLVKFTGLKEQLIKAQETCVANERNGDIESIAIANPAMFHGINPQDLLWSDARASYIRYAASTCVPKDVQSYAVVAASLYERALNREELAAVLEFYRTDVGKKFAEVSARLSEAVNRKMYEESREALRQGGLRFESEMQEIVSRPDSTP